MKETETERIPQSLTLRRVLLFYALGALAGLQFIHLAVTYMGLPHWIGSFGFALALVGLPLVLLGWLVRGKPGAPE